MKILLPSFLLLLLSFGCSHKPDLDDISYIKVFTSGSADSITSYNKGIGIQNYLYYDPRTDSLIYRDFESADDRIYSTHVGLLANEKERDTLQQLITVLSTYPHGITFDTTHNGDTYCGPEFYAEFKDKRGVHYYDFVLGEDRRLNQFSEFFYRLASAPWHHQLVNNAVVSVDSEVVNAMNRLKVYKSRPTPYIPLPCDSSVDRTKIFGTWRPLTVYSEGNEKNYTIITFDKAGTWHQEKIRDGFKKLESQGSFSLNKEGTIFTMQSKGESQKYTVMRLTSSCFEIDL